MRRKRAALLLSLCLISACTACRETPKTDYVTNKEGRESLISDHEQMDNGVSIREQCHAPEHVEAEGKPGNEYTTIKIDANVVVPEKTTIPVYSYTTRHYMEAELKPLADTVFTEGEVKSWNPVDSEYSEEYLYQVIEHIQHELDTMVISDIDEPIWDEETGELIEGNQELYDECMESKRYFEEKLAAMSGQKESTDIDYTYQELSGKIDLTYGIDNDTWARIGAGELAYEDVVETQEYTYQSIGMQGKRNGLTCDLKLDDEGDNTVLYYSIDPNQELKNGSTLSDTNIMYTYHSGYSNKNKCIYSEEEAEGLVKDYLSELGYDGFEVRYVQDLNIKTYDSRMDTEGSKWMVNGYGFILFRGIDGMSECLDRLSQNEGIYTDFMNTNYYTQNLIQPLLECEQWMAEYSGIGTINRYKEMVCADVMDDGVVKLVIINPMQEKELLAEHVELIDFEQALNQGITYMETKYGDRGSYSSRFSLQIKSIQLNYAYMQSPDNPDEYSLIPVWDFRTGPDGTIYATVNAIDGTIFERAALY